jgi:cAMP-binding proteins - catabolite gene activator and regulatory subunit of cAMP-dependent protein kinases
LPSSGRKRLRVFCHAPAPSLEAESVSFSQKSTSNLLLRAVDEASFAILEPHFERVQLKLKDPIFNPNEPITHVYFLEDGVGSIVSEQEDGDQVEVGLYGREGMSGAAVILGAEQSPHASMIQVGNPAALVIPVRSSACRLREERKFAAAAAAVRAIVECAGGHDRGVERPLRFAGAPRPLASDVPRSHRRRPHGADARVLVDDAGRAALGRTVTLHTLEATGAIRSARGVVTIANRGRLEEIAGDSYGQAEAEYRRLIGPFGRGRHGLRTVA